MAITFYVYSKLFGCRLFVKEGAASYVNIERTSTNPEYGIYEKWTVTGSATGDFSIKVLGPDDIYWTQSEIADVKCDNNSEFYLTPQTVAGWVTLTVSVPSKFNADVTSNGLGPIFLTRDTDLNYDTFVFVEPKDLKVTLVVSAEGYEDEVAVEEDGYSGDWGLSFETMSPKGAKDSYFSVHPRTAEISIVDGNGVSLTPVLDRLIVQEKSADLYLVSLEPGEEANITVSKDGWLSIPTQTIKYGEWTNELDPLEVELTGKASLTVNKLIPGSVQYGIFEKVGGLWNTLISKTQTTDSAIFHIAPSDEATQKILVQAVPDGYVIPDEIALLNLVEGTNEIDLEIEEEISTLIQAVYPFNVNMKLVNPTTGEEFTQDDVIKQLNDAHYYFKAPEGTYNCHISKTGFEDGEEKIVEVTYTHNTPALKIELNPTGNYCSVYTQMSPTPDSVTVDGVSMDFSHTYVDVNNKTTAIHTALLAWDAYVMVVSKDNYNTETIPIDTNELNTLGVFRTLTKGTPKVTFEVSPLKSTLTITDATGTDLALPTIAPDYTSTAEKETYILRLSPGSYKWSASKAFYESESGEFKIALGDDPREVVIDLSLDEDFKTVTLSINPENSTVKIDDSEVASTGLVIPGDPNLEVFQTVVEKGLHKIEVLKTGYETYIKEKDKRVNIQSDYSETINLRKLVPVKIKVDKSGASCVMDEEDYLDEVKWTSAENTYESIEVKQGEHNLKITLEGYEEVDEDYTWDEGDVLDGVVLAFELEKKTLTATLRTDPSTADIELVNTITGESVSATSGVAVNVDAQTSYKIFITLADYETMEDIIEVENINVYPDLYILEKTWTWPIRFTSTPTGATVKIDGTEIGTTPMTYEFEEGNYELLIEKDGYESFPSVFVLKCFVDCRDLPSTYYARLDETDWTDKYKPSYCTVEDVREVCNNINDHPHITDAYIAKAIIKWGESEVDSILKLETSLKDAKTFNENLRNKYDTIRSACAIFTVHHILTYDSKYFKDWNEFQQTRETVQRDFDKAVNKLKDERTKRFINQK